MSKHAFLIVVVAAAGMLPARPAAAQAFGQFSGAQTIGMNARLFGAYASFTKSESELLTQLRLSFYPYVDFGFQGGLSRVSVLDRSRTAVKLGGDFKCLAGRHSETFPVDVALGAAIGVSSAEDFNLLSVGPQLVVSRTFGSDTRAKLTPYAGLLLLFTRSDLDNNNDTDTSLPLRLGAEFAPNVTFRVVAELQVALSDEVNDDVKMTLGANFPF